MMADFSVLWQETPVGMICERIAQAGFEAYAVGGCVRDVVMGRPIHDLDMTTNLRPDEIEALFCDYKTLDVGKKHGTITLFVESTTVEITTYRVDGDYADNRHPAAVQFTATLETDLSRRDFTMNALCYSKARGLVDLFGGLTDIQNKVIRTIGEGNRRFSEDALRILRAFRFQSQLDFLLDEATQTAAMDCSKLLEHISAERITSELSKLLRGKNPAAAIAGMNQCGILPALLPTLSQEGLNALGNAPLNLPIRLAVLLGEDYEKSLSMLRFDSKTISQVKLLATHAADKITPDRPAIKRALNSLSPAGLFLLLDYQAACGQDSTAVRAIAEEILRAGECYSVKQLAVNGNDLATLGIQGAEIGTALQFLLSQVMEGCLENEKTILLQAMERKDR